MSYKQIDEQLMEVVKNNWHSGAGEIIDFDKFLHELKESVRLIYTQAKAEQIEECKLKMAKSNEWWNKKLKEATAIRQEGEVITIPTEMPTVVIIHGKPHTLISINEFNYAAILRNGKKPDGKIILTFIDNDFINQNNK